MTRPRRVLGKLARLTVGAAILAGIVAGAEELIRRHYYDRTYRYYEAAAVYSEDQHTLLLYLPDRWLFWTLRPGIRLRAEERIESYGPPQGVAVGRHRAWEIRVGPQGFRGTDFPRRKPVSELRVGCFGDSRTLGEGLSEAQTYPVQLAGRLAGRIRGRSVRVLNLGADGWSSFQGLRLLEREGVAASLDVAVFAFGVNDVDVDFGISDVEMARRFDSPLVTIRRALYRSMIFYWCGYEFLQIKGALFGKTPLRPGPASGEARPRVSPAEFAENLGRFVSVCRAHGIRPILLLLPLNPYYDWGPWVAPRAASSETYARQRERAFDLARRGDLEGAQDLLRVAAGASAFVEYGRTARAVADSLGVAVVDPTPAFDRDQVAGGEPFVDDMHPGASGAAAVARALAEAVLESRPPG